MSLALLLLMVIAFLLGVAIGAVLKSYLLCRDFNEIRQADRDEWNRVMREREEEYQNRQGLYTSQLRNFN